MNAALPVVRPERIDRQIARTCEVARAEIPETVSDCNRGLYLGRFYCDTFLPGNHSCFSRMEDAVFSGNLESGYIMPWGKSRGVIVEKQQNFISLLLPFVPKWEKGQTIDNIRVAINTAWTARKKTIRQAGR